MKLFEAEAAANEKLEKIHTLSIWDKAQIKDEGEVIRNAKKAPA